MKKRYVKKPRTYKKRASFKRGKKTNVRTIVRREIARQAENKIIEGSLGPVNFYQPISAGVCTNLIPNISQGTTQGSRVGNKVRPKVFTLKMAINVNNQSTIYTPAYVDIYIFKYKPGALFPSASLPSNAMDNFLQLGSASTSYTGAIMDGLRYVNKDVFTVVYRKRLLMYNPLNGTGVQGSTANINPCRTLSINLTKHLKKTLMYNDNNTYCTNDDLWLAVGSTQTDGTLIPIVQIGSWSCVATMQYEDM